MRIENAVASEVLERILSSYGFTMQKELAEKLEISSSNVGGWLLRGQVPGTVIVRCALDTGADVTWLVTGKFANSNIEIGKSTLHGRALYEKIQSAGGKPVLRRMLDAYGFRTQKELGDFLDISTATISTWVRREYFPGDAVVACALDTGVSLLWLATGQGNPGNPDAVSYELTYTSIPRMSIASGLLVEIGSWVCDPSFIPESANTMRLVERSNESWLVDFEKNTIGNGNWLLNIDGVHDIYLVSRIPGNKIKVAGISSNFECSVDDVKCIGEVRKTIIAN
ncbi:phage repressor protein CI [Serratia quinivorans]|uniref:phage repressor protein CI n=1 Tax=Serratia quinivorans TaxID=137545 RepID=UPI0021780B96|nr:phage repressor protein CI [Serratia quinivorans]CAI0865048.1 Bacteriophage CI repressor helix-turn-helix domain [Serratia quinivorans]CAI0890984.1 Bacteriophage CI repressor helix-turn-helix domain [Serratia quinivorans]CAI1504323.1 Bacteriophage CI repressor helix-turn-helix domain [Serratia quinivorans]CAI2050165.1 Bacteriophage CI repressor helix-turn-helix domain [Serratia quinivorans]CAI2084388.1 Bacteriophage CI repressor helix-turn-helix domain [Serratia quinivorans]